MTPTKDASKILDAMSQPVLVIDCDYRIVAANSAACSSFCMTPDEIVGRMCFSVSHGLEEPCWNDGETRCAMRAAVELRQRVTVVHGHSRAGKDVFEEITASPILGQDGEVEVVVEETRDVTELVNTKEIVAAFRKQFRTPKGWN
jgi:PAS domain S-box-containing protein